jgi:hypothetical protein
MLNGDGLLRAGIRRNHCDHRESKSSDVSHIDSGEEGLEARLNVRVTDEQSPRPGQPKVSGLLNFCQELPDSGVKGRQWTAAVAGADGEV